MRSDVAFVAERGTTGLAAVSVVSIPFAPPIMAEVASVGHADATDVATYAGVAYLARPDAVFLVDVSGPGNAF